MATASFSGALSETTRMTGYYIVAAIQYITRAIYVEKLKIALQQIEQRVHPRVRENSGSKVLNNEICTSCMAGLYRKLQNENLLRYKRLEVKSQCTIAYLAHDFAFFAWLEVRDKNFR